MPEYVIFIPKHIVSNAICRSENILWSFEVFVSSQVTPDVLMRAAQKIILHILLHISRTAFHKNTFGRLHWKFANVYKIPRRLQWCETLRYIIIPLEVLINTFGILGMLVPFRFMSRDIEPACRPLHDITIS